MAFKETAGTIVIDAVLTDVGRRRMTQGDFEITKFGLGDDEIDYTHGNRTTGEYLIFAADMPPLLEAHAAKNSSINYGIIDFTREDIMYLPQLALNSKIQRSVKLKNGLIYLSVNDETTKKLKSAIDVETELLLNNENMGTMMVIESGIDDSEIVSTEIRRDRFINNLDLFDKYIFMYTDKRLIDKILVNNPNANYMNDQTGRLFQNLAPLSEVPNISLDSRIDNYQTSVATAVQSSIYRHGSVSDELLSTLKGTKAGVMALNFKINQKLVSNSNGAADIRYTKFGRTSQTLFGGTDKYDYIDTIVKFEGCSSKSTLLTTLRIIRYAGT